MRKEGTMKAWHFSGEYLRFDLNKTRVVQGLRVTCEEQRIKPATYGLHASEQAIDALSYAPHNSRIVSRVELDGCIIDDRDNYCASERTHLRVADCTEAVQRFARLCALDVIHLWDAPDVVRRFLETGDRAIVEAAWNAAMDAADAAWITARDARAVQAARAAADAAWAAQDAWAAIGTATTAWAARRAAVWAAVNAAVTVVRTKQNKRLEKMLFDLVGQD